MRGKKKPKEAQSMMDRATEGEIALLEQLGANSNTVFYRWYRFDTLAVPLYPSVQHRKVLPPTSPAVLSRS